MIGWETRGLCLGTQLAETSRIHWTWEFPAWATVLLAGLLVGWIVCLYRWEPTTWRWRSLLATLRILACGLILVMLAQPLRQWYRTTQPPLVILVDRSASMRTCDVTADQPDLSRLQACLTALGTAPLLTDLQQAYQLHLVCFAQQCQTLDPPQLPTITVADDPERGTHVGDAVQFALRELPGPLPAAVVLLTDGNSTGGTSLFTAAEQARTLRVPLLAVPVGSDQPRPDVAVDNFVVEPVVYPGDRLQVTATLRATGAAGEIAHVSLQHDQDSTILARTTVALPAAGVPHTVRLSWQPRQTGNLRLQLSVERLPGEMNIANNHASGSCEVRDEQLRVLLVDSSPSYEFRALKALLKRDPVVDLQVVLQEADADFAAIDAVALGEVPTQDLANYDVLIVGDVDPGLLPRSFWKQLEKFVAVEGGGLVCLAGPRFMPRALVGNPAGKLLWPVELTASSAFAPPNKGSFSLLPTTSGWLTPSLQLGASPAETKKIWQALPPVTWLWPATELKPGAEVLARSTAPGNGAPAIIRHYVGAGEVWLHTTDETWRWRWRGKDHVFARYWGQVLRRLGRGRLGTGQPDVVLTTDKPAYAPGEPTRLQVRFPHARQAPPDPAGVVVQVRPEQGAPQEIAVPRHAAQRGVFQTRLQNLEPGAYEVVLLHPQPTGQTPRTRFHVQLPPSEFAQATVAADALRTAAALTGGSVLQLAELSQLTQHLPQPRLVGDSAQPPYKFWNRPWLLGTLLAILAAEWILRRQQGML